MNKYTKEKQILDDFEATKKQYEQASKSIRNDIVDIYSNYSGKMEDVQSTPYDTKETIPKLRTEIAYVKPFIFSGEPEIQVEGVGDEDKAISAILERIVNYRLSESIPNSYEKIESWVHQAVTFGTSVMRVNWVFKTKKNADGTETPIKDEPDLEVPNILDVYYNPLVPEIDSQNEMIFRSVLSSQQVKKEEMYNYIGADGKRNVDKLEGIDGIEKDNYNSSDQQSSDVLSNQKGMVEVYDIVSADRIITIGVGQKKLVLRDVKNPYGYINAVKLLFEPDAIPNSFNGLGVGQNTLGLGKSFYKMFNQTLTSVKMTNNPMFLFRKGARIDKRQLVSKPAGGIEVDTPGNIGDAIQPLLFPDIKQGAIEILNKIDDEHKRASGASDLVQGSASNKTLGQDQIAQSNTSNRFELIQRRFRHALADVAKMLIDLEIKNLQNIDAPILRIFPQKLREEIYGVLVNQASQTKFNIKVKGETIVVKNRNLESKRLIDLFDLSQNFLTDQEKRAFVRRIAEKQGESNIDEIIAPQPPQEPQQGQLPQQQYNQVGQ